MQQNYFAPEQEEGSIQVSHLMGLYLYTHASWRTGIRHVLWLDIKKSTSPAEVDPIVNTVFPKNKFDSHAARYAISGVTAPTDECGLKLLYFSI